jgi:RNA polymerase sigma factor (sigma-70 family)
MTRLRLDRDLLAGFRAGNPDALSIVYWEYVRKIERLLSAGFELRSKKTRVAGVCRHPDDLADLVQEVFLRAFSEKGRRAYDGLRDYGPYLYAIARNLLVDRARLRGREIPASWAELEAAVDLSPIVEDSEPWATPAIVAVVEEYLARLPRDMGEVHRLRYVEDLSQKQAAEKLGIGRQSLRTLEKRLEKGLVAALDAAEICEDSQPKVLRVRST